MYVYIKYLFTNVYLHLLINVTIRVRKIKLRTSNIIEVFLEELITFCYNFKQMLKTALGNPLSPSIMTLDYQG